MYPVEDATSLSDPVIGVVAVFAVLEPGTGTGKIISPVKNSRSNQLPETRKPRCFHTEALVVI
jgi:hypothetical protein